MSFSDRLLSVRLSVCLSVCKLFTFSSSPQEPLGQFQPNLVQSILGWWGFKVVQMKGPTLFQGGDNNEIAKIHWRTLKILFLRTTGPTSTKISTKHLWVMGIQVYSNEGSCPFPRGDNNTIAKIHWQTLKIFLRNTGPFSTNLGTKLPWVMANYCLFKWRAMPFSKGR